MANDFAMARQLIVIRTDPELTGLPFIVYADTWKKWELIL
jgi:hypothetical protein